MQHDILQAYRNQLNQLRQQCTHVHTLPDVQFFLFGMGARRKMLYQAGKLKDSLTGEIILEWSILSETIIPPLYSVWLTTFDGKTVVISEDVSGVWLNIDGLPQALSLSTVSLPDFAGHPFDLVLRVLHQEILFHVVDGQLGIPNLFVYRKPWYRDGAMMGMVLEKTGNLNLVQDWILNLDEPFDRNNAGETEADNLGQVLYLLSLVSDQTHPLVGKVQALLPQFTEGSHLRGRSDFAEHPVYQTKWAKYGLQALGLADPYHIPTISDSYSSLVWWAYHDSHIDSKRFDAVAYPYLEWAEAHFYHEKPGPMSSGDYPLSWEADASQAHYPGMNIISPLFVEHKVATPHTWHAAEMFLYLLEDYGNSG